MVKKKIGLGVGLAAVSLVFVFVWVLDSCQIDDPVLTMPVGQVGGGIAQYDDLTSEGVAGGGSQGVPGGGIAQFDDFTSEESAGGDSQGADSDNQEEGGGIIIPAEPVPARFRAEPSYEFDFSRIQMGSHNNIYILSPGSLVTSISDVRRDIASGANHPGFNLYGGAPTTGTNQGWRSHMGYGNTHLDAGGPGRYMAGSEPLTGPIHVQIYARNPGPNSNVMIPVMFGSERHDFYFIVNQGQNGLVIPLSHTFEATGSNVFSIGNAGTPMTWNGSNAQTGNGRPGIVRIRIFEEAP